MLKYFDTAVVLQEIPDEITLAINIANCPHQCKNCHSPYLQQDIGEALTFEALDLLVSKHSDISCVCFMGGDSSHEDILELTHYIREKYPELKIAMYSGDDKVDVDLLRVLDYYKVGSYQEDKGPLDNPNTNQVLYHNNNRLIEIITSKFWKK